jgi:DNA phosphorothioation-associated putative methyltransferase
VCIDFFEILRVALFQSRPLSFIVPTGNVLDYGCGRGADVRLLRKSGIPARGWDPHFHPDEPLAPADCVNLGHVLNVIEDSKERNATLQRAFDLADKVLIVAVRVDQGSRLCCAFITLPHFGQG